MKNFLVIIKDIEHLNKKIEEIKEKYNINDFDVKFYDCEKITIRKILNEFDLRPVFSDKILFVIKNVEKISKNDCIMLYEKIKKLPPDIIVILYGDSINPPFKESSLKTKVITPENIFLKEIYGLKMSDNKKIIEILKNYITQREKNFAFIINGIEIYLRNLLIKDKRLTRKLLKKFDFLHNLDYSLKVGLIEATSDFEITLLSYFFSNSN
ncbi:MAG: hypothetical protein N2589_01235 [bacterium]|nr:hypothetical protein [bacterium]